MKLAHRISVKSDFLRKYYINRNCENASRDDIEKIQSHRFRSLVRHAFRESPFYSELYRDYGVHEGDIPELSITDLPIVDKQLIMDNFDLVVCNPKLKKQALMDFISDTHNINRKYLEKYVVIHTSGSSGKIGIYAYDDQDINAVNVLFVRYIYCVKPLVSMLSQKVAFLGAVNGPYAAYTSIGRVQDYHIRFLPVSVEATLDEIIMKINDFKPTILLAYSSMLHKIAEASIGGRLNISPRAIYTGGEKLTEPQIKITQQAFGQKPRSIYGASESLIIGADTIHDEGMYLFNDCNIVETHDEMDLPVPSGQYGRAVLTNLYNYTQPIIRYRMDDILSIDKKPQGKTLPYEMITEIEGRAEDFLELGAKGKQVSIHPIIFVEFYVPGLKQLQIIKKAPDRFIARVAVSSTIEQVGPNIRSRLQQILDNHSVGDSVTFDIEVVDIIPNDARTGKYRLIINEFH